MDGRALVVMTLTAVASFGVSAQQNQMCFFVTSVGSGIGANLGGLAGADKICQTLAGAAGAGTALARLSQRRGRSRTTGRQR